MISCTKSAHTRTNHTTCLSSPSNSGSVRGALPQHAHAGVTRCSTCSVDCDACGEYNARCALVTRTYRCDILVRFDEHFSLLHCSKCHVYTPHSSQNTQHVILDSRLVCRTAHFQAVQTSGMRRSPCWGACRVVLQSVRGVCVCRQRARTHAPSRGTLASGR
jgi:hypothetical protein